MAPALTHKNVNRAVATQQGFGGPDEAQWYDSGGGFSASPKRLLAKQAPSASHADREERNDTRQNPLLQQLQYYSLETRTGVDNGSGKSEQVRRGRWVLCLRRCGCVEGKCTVHTYVLACVFHTL